jgi:hypothetical protein
MNSAGPRLLRPSRESLASGRGRKPHSTRGESCERSTLGAQRVIGRPETRARRRSSHFVRRAVTGALLSAFFNSRAFNSFRISRGLLPTARNWATSGGSLSTSGSDPSLQAEAASIAAASGQAANRRLVMMPLNCESPRWARARRSASDGLRRYRAAAGARRGGDAI